MKLKVRNFWNPRKKILHLIFGCLLASFVIGSAPQKSYACCSCLGMINSVDRPLWDQTVEIINNHVTTEFTTHRIWIVQILWEDNILPALMMMTEQLSAVAMQQIQIIGAFLDAKHQLETQQVLQTLGARAHKDYQPSVGMCEFGSNAKSLAASERRSEFNAVLMSQRSQDRSLGNAYTAAAAGEYSDKESRIRQFREKFCDPQDNNSGLAFLCDQDQDGDPSSGPTGAQDPVRMNKDIDYNRTLATPWTLDVNFTDTTLTDDEEEVLALANNLYGHNVFKRPPAGSLKDKRREAITDMQKFYLDARSVVAKRSVAENSFNAITAMKSSGTPGSREFMLAVLEELGVDGNTNPAETELLLGENPSYYAQMEVLTKKIFQNPDFYTNLYDKPVNVDRKGVALQAISLMQKFDLFKSYLRNEASLSVLLELAVEDLQEEIENEINQVEAGGESATD